MEEKEEVPASKEDLDEEMDSEGDDEEDDAQTNIDALAAAVTENPYVYDNHTALIAACKEAGEFDQLQNARQKMQELFPLSEEIWLSWLQDEIKFCESKSQEDRMRITNLFEKAVKDYLSVPLWLEYIQFSIGGLDSPNGLNNIRDVCERALTHAGLHVVKGSNLWEAYRELENVILARYLPSDGVMKDKTQEDKFDEQHKKIVGLFKRQLSVPLRDMKSTLNEYKEWMGEDVDKFVLQTYQKAVTKLSSIQAFEDRLLSDNPDDPTHMNDYNKYLDHEVNVADPARIQCLFERAITDNCLQPSIWIKYTQYLDKKLKIKDIILTQYQRSTCNCPWSLPLWLAYLQALERHTQPHTTIKGVFKQALSSCVSTATDSLQLWTLYCEYCRRRINWSQEHSEVLEEFREAVDNAINAIYNAFGNDGDPQCTLQRFSAYIEASHCKNMEKAREQWKQVMESHSHNAHMWLEYFTIERAYGNKKHCRKLLQQALYAAKEEPELIVEAYLNYEKCEGTLEEFDDTKTRCDTQMAIVEERRKKAADKEAKFTDAKKSKQNQKPNQKEKQKQNQKFMQNSAQKTTQKSTKPHHDTFKVPQTSKSHHKEIFKVPLPVMDGEMAQPPHKKPRLDKAQDNGTQSHTEDSLDMEREDKDSDPDKNNRTVFVSNLTYSIDEDKLAGLFAKCGILNDVRLVKNITGTSKGFAYIEFHLKESCELALRMDRQSVEGRPMYVSAFKSKEQSTHFKYSTEIEKRKLFVSNLPYTCRKEALEKVFSEHGTITSVRMVTYKSGAPKGLAYVEFANETEASQAIIKTDGLMIGDHSISVAISNPPSRKQPIKTKEEDYVPTLGSGKKETEQRGKARTQLSMMPRAVSRAKPTPSSSSSKSIKTGQSTTKAPPNDNKSTNENGDKSTNESTEVDKGGDGVKMSNSDFRALLLKK